MPQDRVMKVSIARQRSTRYAGSARAAAVVSAALLAGGTMAAGPNVINGGALVLATTLPPPSWNPLTVNGDITTNRQQQWPLYPHAFLIGRDAGVTLNTDLLSSARIVSADPMVVEYVIKPAAVWSDGVPITADDFSYTQAVQDPKRCPTCRAAITQGYDDITNVGSADGGKTVRVSFAKPYSSWRTLFPYILPAHVATAYGDLATSFNVGLSQTVPKVSGGPYLVTAYQKGVVLSLGRNPRWYGGPAHLETIRFRYIASIGEQVTALQNGEIDALVGGATLDTIEQVQQTDGVTVDVGPTLTYYHFSLKAAGDVMGSKPLRQAIVRALSNADMTRRTLGQYVKQARPMSSAAYIPGQKVAGIAAAHDNTGATGVGSGDIAGALGVLKAAGYTIVDGHLHLPGGAPMRSIRVLTYANDPIRVQLAELAQAQLALIGITVVINSADGSRYNAEAQAGNFDLYATGTALDEGAQSLAQWYKSGGARNYFGYSSPAVDTLIDKISVTLDDAEAVRLTNQLDLALLNDAVVVPLFPVTNIVVLSSKYANIFVNPSKYGSTMNIQDWGLVPS
jgi:peptide/nickel transport system substrate-binding protein